MSWRKRNATCFLAFLFGNSIAIRTELICNPFTPIKLVKTFKTMLTTIPRPIARLRMENGILFLMMGVGGFGVGGFFTPQETKTAQAIEVSILRAVMPIEVRKNPLANVDMPNFSFTTPVKNETFSKRAPDSAKCPTIPKHAET